MKARSFFIVTCTQSPIKLDQCDLLMLLLHKVKKHIDNAIRRSSTENAISNGVLSLFSILMIATEGGGGARKSVRTPSSNIVEFKMGIKNLLSKLKSDFKEKRYDGLKKGA